jgi:threonyl-tRNA synthetase
VSPRQAIVVPIAAAHKGYAQEVMQTLWDAGIYTEVDLSDVTYNKKIVRVIISISLSFYHLTKLIQRNAEISQTNFILSKSLLSSSSWSIC